MKIFRRASRVLHAAIHVLIIPPILSLAGCGGDTPIDSGEEGFGIVRPARGDTLTLGRSYPILYALNVWASLLVSTDEGGSWDYISHIPAYQPGSRFFQWFVDADPTTSARLKLRSDDSLFSSLSGRFVITDKDVLPFFDVAPGRRYVYLFTGDYTSSPSVRKVRTITVASAYDSLQSRIWLCTIRDEYTLPNRREEVSMGRIVEKMKGIHRYDGDFAPYNHNGIIPEGVRPLARRLFRSDNEWEITWTPGGLVTCTLHMKRESGIIFFEWTDRGFPRGDEYTHETWTLQ